MAAGTPIEGSANVCDGTLASERGNAGLRSRIEYSTHPRSARWLALANSTGPHRTGTKVPAAHAFVPLTLTLHLGSIGSGAAAQPTGDGHAGTPISIGVLAD